ncbi:hypothetical protein ASC80_02215 [Afipia sp. Root123D2]|uniref:hypothetical protein n=1 Tax=Afipia sp. Root123D2 TaxID=1736436 RepID=UPI0006F77DF9|nr:hypothetical protein [Afipia sp. Root123D2]KQW22230.1 hypothetical protein ASC80_02215 [Afipia sp. Root123D2]
MSTVDWKSVEAQLRSKTPAQIQSENAAAESAKAEADILKHIADALKLDTTNPDRSSSRRD